MASMLLSKFYLKILKCIFIIIFEYILSNTFLFFVSVIFNIYIN